jgi:hypothetical protein
MKLRRHLSQWLVVFGVLLVPSALFAQNVWTVGGRISQPRALATVTALDDGRVLIAGGYSDPLGGSPFNTVEIHNPSTGETVLAAPLPEAKGFHVAVKLSDGRVAVFGGLTAMGFSNRVDIFDPHTNTWQAAIPMPMNAALMLVAPLGNDRFLVAGGASDLGDLETAYIYDATIDSWTQTGSMAIGHMFGTVAVLQSGKVLVAGGMFTSTAELYDATTGAFTSVSDTGLPRTQLARLIALPDGRAFLVGSGFGDVIYDPTANAWTPAAPMPAATVAAGATLLADGRVLVAGGVDPTAGADTTATYLYDPGTDVWSPGSPMHEPHGAFEFAALANGRMLAVGHYIGTSTAIEYYGPPNTPPVANAGADLTAFTCDTCLGSVTVNAGASADPDGDALTFTWSAGGIPLLTTTSPTAQLAISSDMSLTLTVRDRFGAESTDDVIVTLLNVEDGYRATIATLETELAACRANGAAAAMTELETFFRNRFSDAAFELPGNSAEEELAQLLAAIKTLNYGQQQAIFRALGGQPGRKQ